MNVRFPLSTSDRTPAPLPLLPAQLAGRTGALTRRIRRYIYPNYAQFRPASVLLHKATRSCPNFATVFEKSTTQLFNPDEGRIDVDLDMWRHPELGVADLRFRRLLPQQGRRCRCRSQGPSADLTRPENMAPAPWDPAIRCLAASQGRCSFSCASPIAHTLSSSTPNDRRRLFLAKNFNGALTRARGAFRQA